MSIVQKKNGHAGRSSHFSSLGLPLFSPLPIPSCRNSVSSCVAVPPLRPHSRSGGLFHSRTCLPPSATGSPPCPRIRSSSSCSRADPALGAVGGAVLARPCSSPPFFESGRRRRRLSSARPRATQLKAQDSSLPDRRASEGTTVPAIVENKRSNQTPRSGPRTCCLLS